MVLRTTQISTGRIFRILLIASVTTPLFLFAVTAWLSYDSAFHDTERDLMRAASVVQEHALKVFETHQLLAARVNTIINELEGANPNAEHIVHETLKGMVSGMPQVRTIWVLDRTGHAVASTSTYPVPRNVDFSDRDYFAELRNHPIDTHVSEVLKGRVDNTLFFSVAKRMEKDGAFNGVISISADPMYFSEFYEKLAKNDDYLFALIRADGALLARYPNLATPYPFPKLPSSGVLMTAIRGGGESGSFTSTFQTDGIERLAAYRKLGGYPIYVVAARKSAAVISDWRSGMSGYLLFGIPATSGLFALTLVAARRTQREWEARTLLEGEMLRREDAERALYQAQKMEAIGRITSGVAHDFNNVLQGVSGCLGTLHARNTDPAANRLFEAAQQGIERGARLTLHLLAFARRQTLTPKPTDIGALLDGMRPLLERSMGGLIRISIDVTDGTWPALVDPTQLEVAILNLAINARDAMPVGGRLAMKASNTTVMHPGEPGHPAEVAPGDYVVIQVEDTGTGMDVATLSRAVEPFFTTKEPGKGSGLGLSMVYGMAAQSGGGMHIASQPGQGTTVSVYLPRAEQPIKAEPPSTGESVQGDSSTVLLVDDDALVRMGTTAVLEGQGYRVLATDSGTAALKILQAGTAVDVLVTDYAMPGMTGAALIRAARHLAPALPVLLITGYADLPEDIDQVPLLQKPFRPGELGAHVAALIGSERPGHATPLSLHARM